MTKQQLSLIRQASLDSADGGTKWRKRMERWMDTLKPVEYFKLGLGAWILPSKHKSTFGKEWKAVAYSFNAMIPSKTV